jgi:hypothetical protein
MREREEGIVGEKAKQWKSERLYYEERNIKSFCKKVPRFRPLLLVRVA